MKVVVLYIGSSLLAPLRSAERELNRKYALDLSVVTHNFGGPFTDDQWQLIEQDLRESEIRFVIHVMDGENAARLLPLLDRVEDGSVVVINCMPKLMKRTRMGKLDLARLSGAKGKALRTQDESAEQDHKGKRLLTAVSSWIGRQTRNHKRSNGHGRADYLKMAARLPKLLRFMPNTGRLGDAKNYLLLVSYFLQPTPNNIQSMILCALKNYLEDDRLQEIKVPPPEVVASQAIYHPDAPALFESFEAYQRWYQEHLSKSKDQNPKTKDLLSPASTIGLLLMRPQIVSRAHKHYDALIRAIEAEGLSVIPAISTLMDNREAVERFFVGTHASGVQLSEHAGPPRTPRVSQIV